ncbi:MAG TPA: hypothetical protein VHG89_03800 [Verrucomicrobiae bacterium]|nr:hypothetical protein [Verrucomicrobiae bacterium]
MFALTAVALLCVAGKAQAQTETNLPPQTSFFGSVENYFTSFDTNSTTFTSERGEVWTGVVYQNGLNFADDLGVDYNLGAKGIYAEGIFRNAGIAGTIVGAQAGLGYSIVHFDTKLSVGVDGGYDFNRDNPCATFYVDARKALTENTFAGLRLGWEAQFSHSPVSRTPELSVIIGFKF